LESLQGDKADTQKWKKSQARTRVLSTQFFQNLHARMFAEFQQYFLETHREVFPLPEEFVE